MKNILTCYFIGIWLILLSNVAFSATTGTVKFSGAVIDTPCNLTLSASSSTSLTIDMGAYMKDKVPRTSGQKIAGSEKPLEIRLTDCPHNDGYNILPKIIFKANPDDHNTKLIKLEGSGAEGIGVGLYDSAGNLLDIRKTYQPGLATPRDTSTSLTIPFKAAYVSNGQTAKAGKANASVSFEVSYK
ncbi:MAG TPA: fimbrial protein [Arsenophonus sp.]